MHVGSWLTQGMHDSASRDMLFSTVLADRQAASRDILSLYAILNTVTERRDVSIRRLVQGVELSLQ